MKDFYVIVKSKDYPGDAYFVGQNRCTGEIDLVSFYFAPGAKWTSDKSSFDIKTFTSFSEAMLEALHQRLYGMSGYVVEICERKENDILTWKEAWKRNRHLFEV